MHTYTLLWLSVRPFVHGSIEVCDFLTVVERVLVIAARELTLVSSHSLSILFATMLPSLSIALDVTEPIKTCGGTLNTHLPPVRIVYR